MRSRTHGNGVWQCTQPRPTGHVLVPPSTRSHRVEGRGVWVVLVCHGATVQQLATALRLTWPHSIASGARSNSKRKVKKGKITLGDQGLLYLQKRPPACPAWGAGRGPSVGRCDVRQRSWSPNYARPSCAPSSRSTAIYGTPATSKPGLGF